MQNIPLKFTDYRLIFTFICIIINKTPYELTIQFLAVLGVLTVGILHGANDLSLIKKLGFLKSKSQRFVTYVCFVLFFSTLLYGIPMFALVLFVIISAYHFGEQQWHKYQASSAPRLTIFYFTYGLFLFSFLFYIHNEEVTAVIYQISAVVVPPIFFAIFALTSSVLLSFILFFSIKSFKDFLMDFLIQTAIILLLFWTTNLLVSFAVYFVFWHSWPSLRDQANALYGPQGSFKKYLKDAWFYWVLSIIGLSIMYFYNATLGLDPMALFFSFLAAITFPHVLVIFGLNRLLKPSANA